MSTWGYSRERNGILGNMLNSHPVALKHVMPAMMHFYIGRQILCYFSNGLFMFFEEVEQTGASSQFYDKFSMFFVLYRASMHSDAAHARCQAKHFFHFENRLEQPRSSRSTETRGQVSNLISHWFSVLKLQIGMLINSFALSIS